MAAVTSRGAGRPGMRAGGDADVGLLQGARDHLTLPGEIGIIHLPGIASFGFGVAGAGDFHEGGTKTLHLLLDSRTHVEGLDHGAEPPCRGNGLEPRHAGAKDQYPRRRDCSGGHHHHGHGAAEEYAGVQHRLVTGQAGLGCQGVHRLARLILGISSMASTVRRLAA